MRVLTFDVEEWFHLLDYSGTQTEAEWTRFPRRLEANVDRILGLLQDSGAHATFFCLGWIAEQFPHVIRRIAELGYEIASHSYAHQLAYEQTPEEFRHDLRRSLRVLEALVGQRVNTYRVPGFALKRSNPWVLDVLLEEGIEVDCSIFPAQRGHGGFPQFGLGSPARVTHSSGVLKELPINVVGIAGASLVFSGGGYFRLLPYAILRRLFASRDYIMTYFHPRDFDPGQPRIEGLPPGRRFRSYYGLAGAETKLRRLLAEFSFIDVRTAVARVDWNTLPLIKV